jgi:hypothetical protein
LETRTPLILRGSSLTPYSLGKLIDWKHHDEQHRHQHPCLPPPYSLGKLIDWKHCFCSRRECWNSELLAPYSLGKLIDWKLISNLLIKVYWEFNRGFNLTPYSLGKLIDWKLHLIPVHLNLHPLW